MPAWWQRVMSHDVPSYILAAAAPTVADVPPASAPLAGAPVATAEKLPEKPRSAPVDLSALSLGDDSALIYARQLAAGVFNKIEAAYASGHDDQIRLWQPRWEKAADSLRKMEEAHREAQTKRRILVNRAEVDADINEAVDMLRMMRENMVRRVLEVLPSLASEMLEKIESAIRSEREKEELVFQSLPSLKPSDVLL
jgi:hypothetical protein